MSSLDSFIQSTSKRVISKKLLFYTQSLPVFVMLRAAVVFVINRSLIVHHAAQLFGLVVRVIDIVFVRHLRAHIFWVQKRKTLRQRKLKVTFDYFFKFFNKECSAKSLQRT